MVQSQKRRTYASGACAKSHFFRRCDGSSFKQEGTRPRAHPPLRSLVCCIDNGTGARSAAKISTACLRRFVEGGRNGLWPRNRERFFEDRNMERSTCACCNELKAPSRTRTVSIEEGGSWLARIRTRLTWEHTTFACSAEVIDSTKRLYSSEASLLTGEPLAPSAVAIDEQGSVEVEEPFARKL